MIDFITSATQGIVDLPWWGYVLVLLGTTHITIAAVTIFLHRTQAHRGLDLHPIVSHFFRMWLWLTTGQVTKEWVSIHRKHHAKCDTVDDPHCRAVLELFRRAHIHVAMWDVTSDLGIPPCRWARTSCGSGGGALSA